MLLKNPVYQLNCDFRVLALRLEEADPAGVAPLLERGASELLVLGAEAFMIPVRDERVGEEDRRLLGMSVGWEFQL